jgi:hypothetical protein
MNRAGLVLGCAAPLALVVDLVALALGTLSVEAVTLGTLLMLAYVAYPALGPAIASLWTEGLGERGEGVARSGDGP